VKLSTLLRAVTAESAKRAKHDRQERNALCARPHAKLSDPDISAIHYRAQDVRPGGLFVAIQGQVADGHAFIDEALKNGAAAVVTQKKVKQDAIVIQVPDTRQALADISAQFYGNPSEQMVLVGITGTNGKTTTAFLIESILEKAGFEVGVISTINYRYTGKTFDNPMTTPESLDLQQILAEMRTKGVTHVVMEASSHAIDLYRIKSCWFDVGVFTNLSQDHLDFHGSMQSYWASKKKLFTDYLSLGPKKDRAVAVINCNDNRGKELADLLTLPNLKIGTQMENDIRIENYQCDLNGVRGTILTPRGDFRFESAMAGEHNLENILCAAGAAAALMIPPDTIKAGLEAVAAVPGRLERIENNTGRFVYVDYAHTPDALENVLTALKVISSHRIICIFGCGGDRDKAKRPLIGEIAGNLSDLAVITSDNPRTEKPLDIIAEILAGTEQSGTFKYTPADLTADFKKKGYVVEPDRRSAIELGISISRPGDTVLIAGKGHETYQILGDRTIDFDDREEARKALCAVGGQ